jgi:hypothetical protein
MQATFLPAYFFVITPLQLTFGNGLSERSIMNVMMM